MSTITLDSETVSKAVKLALNDADKFIKDNGHIPAIIDGYNCHYANGHRIIDEFILGLVANNRIKKNGARSYIADRYAQQKPGVTAIDSIIDDISSHMRMEGYPVYYDYELAIEKDCFDSFLFCFEESEYIIINGFAVNKPTLKRTEKLWRKAYCRKQSLYKMKDINHGLITLSIDQYNEIKAYIKQ